MWEWDFIIDSQLKHIMSVCKVSLFTQRWGNRQNIHPFCYTDVQVAFWGEVSRKNEVCGFAECITLMMLKKGCFWRLPPDLPFKWLCLPIPAHATPLTRTHLQCFASTCLAWSFELWWSVPVDLFIFFPTTGSLDRRKCKRRSVMEHVGLYFNKKHCPGSSWWEWAASIFSVRVWLMEHFPGAQGTLWS